MFIKGSKIVILLENVDHAEEEKENKIQGFSKEFLLYELVHQNVGNWIRFLLHYLMI
jgi:hypothetical protein